jgi:hypothetical protein
MFRKTWMYREASAEAGFIFEDLRSKRISPTTQAISSTKALSSSVTSSPFRRRGANLIRMS